MSKPSKALASSHRRSLRRRKKNFTVTTRAQGRAEYICHQGPFKVNTVSLPAGSEVSSTASRLGLTSPLPIAR